MTVTTAINVKKSQVINTLLEYIMRDLAILEEATELTVTRTESQLS